MDTRLSSKGQVVLPASFRRKLDLRPGDALDARRNGANIILTPRQKPVSKARLVIDPVTGISSLKCPEGAPIFRSRDVREMLADFR